MANDEALAGVLFFLLAHCRESTMSDDDEKWGVEEEPSEAIALVPPALPERKWKTKEEKQVAKFKRIEERVFRKNLKIIESIAGAADYDDDADRQEVSAEEAHAHGSMTAALRHKRIAMDARRPKKLAPVYLDHANAVVVGILKARAAEEARVGKVNTNGANITVHIHGKDPSQKAWDAEYEEISIDEKESP